MLKSRIVIFCLVLAPLTAACGNELTVEVLTEAAGELRPVDDLEVQFLPFDRDSVFEVLTERAAEEGSPEPQVPEELNVAYDSVLALQEAWRDAESRWNEVRDELRGLSDRLKNLDPRSREYRELFDRFNELERRERALNRQRQQTFDQFTELQQVTQTRIDSVKAVISAWEDDAFADFGEVEAGLVEALGREIVTDTTDDQGRLTVTLPGGTWWVHTRVPVPAGELYWNVPVDPGATDTLRLTPENAERRRDF